MASSFNIGRIPLAYGPDSIEHDGTFVTITGHIQEATLRKTLHYRDQLNEYARHPYDVIPVWWDDDATSLPKGWTEINGWYRVTDVSIDMLSYVGTGIAEFTITLDRLGGRDDVDWQTVTTSSYRDAETTSARERYMYYPHGARYTQFGQRTPSGGTEPFRGALSVGNPNAAWSVDPAKFITDTSSIPLLKADGLPVVGLNMPSEYTTWSLSTGHFTIESLDSSQLGWVITHQDGDTNTVTMYRAVSGVGTASMTPNTYVEVLHNSFSEVVIRTHMDAPDQGTLDIRMRRGGIGATFTYELGFPFYDVIVAFPSGVTAASTLGQIFAPTSVPAGTFAWTFWGFELGEWTYVTAPAAGTPAGPKAISAANPPSVLTWGLFYSTSSGGTPTQFRRSAIQDTYGNVTYMRDKAVRR